METEAHIIVKGLVQGVGFRYFAHRMATGLGLTGYVKNLYTGDVEIVASGERSLIEEYIKQVKVGPRSAQVNDMLIDWRAVSRKFTTFEIH
jgi:acylphosphatase